MSDFLHHSDAPGKEKNRLLRSIVIPVAFVVMMWLVKSIELFFDLDLSRLGIFPLKARGLPGIVLSPFIHGDLKHLVNNSIPILVLGSTLFYFYREVAKNVLLLSILITGLWVWVFAREAWHIGASGVVYSLAAFLFTSGVIRRHPRLMAISLLVTFLYGSLVWGILPIRERVSWESHLMGLISGVLLAYHFRRFGPQRKKYDWELEEEEEDDEENPQNDFAERVIRSLEEDHSLPPGEPGRFSSYPKVKYNYKPKDKPEGKED
ncbi:MAG: rhomboid family intramembrane serine protease [Bacteroidales bacterium]|nr:rhomboid family intramembrane serine protease [Bacteroidales bacterium]NLM93896.1 rhomboid family intramembrane serine protease [Bacteroidales bacterium]